MMCQSPMLCIPRPAPALTMEIVTFTPVATVELMRLPSARVKKQRDAHHVRSHMRCVVYRSLLLTACRGSITPSVPCLCAAAAACVDLYL